MEFRADQIIGKSLTAKTPVKIYRAPDDNAPPVYTVNPGENIGVVTSYLNPGPGRSVLYWVYRDQTGRNYYTRHAQGRYDIDALQNQGAQSTAEELQAEAEKKKTLSDKIFASVNNFFLIGAAVYLLATVIKTRK